MRRCSRRLLLSMSVGEAVRRKYGAFFRAAYFLARVG